MVNVGCDLNCQYRTRVLLQQRSRKNIYYFYLLTAGLESLSENSEKKQTISSRSTGLKIKSTYEKKYSFLLVV